MGSTVSPAFSCLTLNISVQRVWLHHTQNCFHDIYHIIRSDLTLALFYHRFNWSVTTNAESAFQICYLMRKNNLKLNMKWNIILFVPPTSAPAVSPFVSEIKACYHFQLCSPGLFSWAFDPVNCDHWNRAVYHLDMKPQNSGHSNTKIRCVYRINSIW